MTLGETAGYHTFKNKNIYILKMLQYYSSTDILLTRLLFIMSAITEFIKQTNNLD